MYIHLYIFTLYIYTFFKHVYFYLYIYISCVCGLWFLMVISCNHQIYFNVNTGFLDPSLWISGEYPPAVRFRLSQAVNNGELLGSVQDTRMKKLFLMSKIVNLHEFIIKNSNLIIPKPIVHVIYHQNLPSINRTCCLNSAWWLSQPALKIYRRSGTSTIDHVPGVSPSIRMLPDTPSYDAPGVVFHRLGCNTPKMLSLTFMFIIDLCSPMCQFYLKNYKN